MTINQIEVSTSGTYYIFVRGVIKEVSPLNPATIDNLVLYGIGGVQKMSNVNTVFGLDLVKFSDLNTNVKIPMYVVNPVTSNLEAYAGTGTLLCNGFTLPDGGIVSSKIYLFNANKGLILISDVKKWDDSSTPPTAANDDFVDGKILKTGNNKPFSKDPITGVGGNVTLQWKNVPVGATDLADLP